MLKEKFHIQKSVVLSLALTGVVCAMDNKPVPPKTEEAIQELRKDPDSLFSHMPEDLDANIGKYKPFVTLYCPTVGEIEEAISKNKGKESFDLTDANTGFTFSIFRYASGKVKFNLVEIHEGHNQPFIQCQYKGVDGIQHVIATMGDVHFKSKPVASCHADPVFRTQTISGSLFEYKTETSNPRDIAITCPLK